MRIIKEADQTILKVWNEGKIENVNYRLFTFLIQSDIKEGTLLLNTVTGEMILLNQNEIKDLKLLPCSYSSWMDELIKKHFLVKENLNDVRTIESLRKINQMINASKEITGYTILPTTNCNAHCFYCYECNAKHENMSDETADQLVNYMVAHKGDKPISISWFGGEPLVGICQIDRISKTLKERNVEFSSTMVSNGYLFDKELAKRIGFDWNLKRVQITIDGTEVIYNKTKAYKNITGSPYQKVLDNIGYLLENKIYVVIRLNLGMHNYEDINLLLDELGERFQDKSHLSVYTSLLFDNCGYDSIHFNEDELNLLYSKKRELDNKIRNYDRFSHLEKLPKLKTNKCMADNNNSLLVNPQGNFGKCEHYFETHLVGNLDEGIINNNEINLLKERLIYSKCSSCPLYPSCIKFKLCEADNLCNKSLISLEIEKVQFTMNSYYENVLTKPSDEDTIDDIQNC